MKCILLFLWSSRLIPSPDARTVSATLVFLINCLHSSKNRMYVDPISFHIHQLKDSDMFYIVVSNTITTDGNGLRLLKAILHRMALSFDVENSADESQIFELRLAVFICGSLCKATLSYL